MKRPKRNEFMKEVKFDGKLYKSVDEDKYKSAMRKWEDYNRTLERHHH